ncbi:cytochrome-c peroxidase [Algoriphagus formosus]|uniref:cytochrome-c peroxidase n=1 Tax=Algoriphagus formosus TaxID=2007308 RepID=UPI000C281243|nr:cytochrome c peroxidase [Algoriphagus formosus]
MKTSRLLVLALVWSFWSCQDENLLPESPVEVVPETFIPELSSSLQVGDFPQPERNPLSKEGVKLGKRLFFDPKLSANGKISCASCHLPSKAFTDGVALSKKGVSGNALHRHSSPLFNLAWHTTGLFWDGGANDLESLNFGPLTHPDEMAADLEEIVAYLIQDKTYPELFAQAFPKNPIQSATISRALSQYTRTLISQTSKYDDWKRGEATLNSLELQGYQLYQNHCSSCHQEGLFTDLDYHNNGLDLIYPDPPALEGLFLGRFRISFDSLDLGAYKTPSLRNVTLTAPYMHDGRFESLEEVLDHYQSGIQVNYSLAPQLKEGINLSPDERKALLSFLKTLQDDAFVLSHIQDSEK